MASTSAVNGEEVTILVEVDDLSARPSEWGATRERVGRVMEASRDVFGDGLDLAQDCAARTVESINAAAAEMRPDEFEVQLAIKLDAQVGAVITKLGVGAQMQVTMRWRGPLGHA